MNREKLETEADLGLCKMPPRAKGLAETEQRTDMGKQMNFKWLGSIIEAYRKGVISRQRFITEWRNAQIMLGIVKPRKDGRG